MVTPPLLSGQYIPSLSHCMGGNHLLRMYLLFLVGTYVSGSQNHVMGESEIVGGIPFVSGQIPY